MKAMIAKLEAATEGSRELDAEVYAETHRVGAFGMSPEGAEMYTLSYTTSIDAALTLVPEGMEVGLDIFKDGTAICGVYEELSNGTTICATPSLALCIAALKARTATTPSCRTSSPPDT